MKFYAILICCCLLSLPKMLFSTIQEDKPWFAGPLLAYPSENATPGQIVINPYFTLNRVRGSYDGKGRLNPNLNIHEYQFYLELDIGLIPNFELLLSNNSIYATSQDMESIYYGNVDILLCFQFMHENRKGWQPDARLMIGEAIPNGDYTSFNSRISETVVTSAGGFSTNIILAMGKAYRINDPHPFAWTFNAYYLIPTKIHLQGLTHHGGDETTNGYLSAGTAFQLDLAFEYKFNDQWGVMIDFLGVHQYAGKFSPIDIGSTEPGLAPSSSISIAPGVQYNFSTNFNIAAGSWLTIFGRNASAFTMATGFLTYSF